MSGKVLDFKTRKVRTRECSYGLCLECEHQWVAPAIGKCPHCGSERTEALGHRRFDYERLR